MARTQAETVPAVAGAWVANARARCTRTLWVSSMSTSARTWCPGPKCTTIDSVGHMNHAGGVDVGDQQIAGSISGRLQMVLCPVESSGRGWVLQRIEAEMSTGAWILGW